MSVFNQSRSNVIKLIFIGAFLLLAIRLFQFQILGSDYGKLADSQAYTKKIVWPDRGLFLDRHGKKMVNNIIVYDATLTIASMKNFDTISFCRIMNIDTATFRERMKDLNIKNRGNKFKPGIFQSLISPEVHSKLEEKLYNFPGLDLVQRPERTYPFNVGGNIFGYLNEVDTSIINKSNGELNLGDLAGIAGLEKYYDRVLRGQKGVEIFVRDKEQKIVGKYKNGKYDTLPVAGRNLKTFMDIKLQVLAEKLMKNKMGAAVALDPKTGGILAMATGPGYDPNLLSGENKRKNIGQLITDPTGPTYNFATIGEYPPGSTFKPLGALVALDEGVMTPSSGVGCGGRYRGCGGRGVGCHGGGHGGNLRSAMAASCNSYFISSYRKALDNPKYATPMEGYMEWKKYMNSFGLGIKLGIDLPVERRGNIPDTAGKRGLNKSIGSTVWNSCATMTMGIGQDRMLATPLQMANAMCIIANRGYYYTPHFVDSIEGETKKDTLLNKFRIKHVTLHIPDSSYDAVFDGMEAVLTGGTARKWLVPGIRMCGKTGTAENFRNGKKQKDHSWFVCFAPKENPQIAIAVLVQNGGFGTDIAAPIASLMVEQYLTDTISKRRSGFVKSYSEKKMIPSYIKEEKRIQDSTLAWDRFESTGDSIHIQAYLPPPPPPIAVINKDSLAKVEKEKLEKLKKEAENKHQPTIPVKNKEAGTLPKKPDVDKPKQKKDTIKP